MDTRMTAVPPDVVIIHYEKDDLTEALLDDLRRVCADSVGRVIVVDNGSNEAFRVADGDLADVVRLEEGQGFSGAVMAGRESVRTPAFMLLNNDLRIQEDPVPALVERWKRTGAGAVGPRLEFPDGRYQLSWGDELGLLEEFRERRRQRQMRAGGGNAVEAQERRSRLPRRVAWLSGAAMLVDTDAFDTIGGFDRDYWFYFEDVDFCHRLNRSGFALWYEPAARVVHLLGATADDPRREVPERLGMAHLEGHVRYYLKHRPRWETRALQALLLMQTEVSPALRRQPWRRRAQRRIIRPLSG